MSEVVLFRVRQQGLSLLEVLVALVIMAMSLALLYRASGESIRAVMGGEANARAVMLAESVLASHDAVPSGGWNEQGEDQGMRWVVTSSRFLESSNVAMSPTLYAVNVEVVWPGVLREQRLHLSGILPERRKILGSGGT